MIGHSIFDPCWNPIRYLEVVTRIGEVKYVLIIEHIGVPGVGAKSKFNTLDA